MCLCEGQVDLQSSASLPSPSPPAFSVCLSLPIWKVCALEEPGSGSDILRFWDPRVWARGGASYAFPPTPWGGLKPPHPRV